MVEGVEGEPLGTWEEGRVCCDVNPSFGLGSKEPQYDAVTGTFCFTEKKKQKKAREKERPYSTLIKSAVASPAHRTTSST